MCLVVLLDVYGGWCEYVVFLFEGCWCDVFIDCELDGGLVCFVDLFDIFFVVFFICS